MKEILHMPIKSVAERAQYITNRFKWDVCWAAFRAVTCSRLVRF